MFYFLLICLQINFNDKGPVFEVLLMNNYLFTHQADSLCLPACSMFVYYLCVNNVQLTVAANIVELPSI